MKYEVEVRLKCPAILILPFKILTSYFLLQTLGRLWTSDFRPPASELTQPIYHTGGKTIFVIEPGNEF